MTAAPREIELKLEFDPADARRIKRHLQLDSGKTRHASEKLVSVYFDTPDRELNGAGLSLRVRRIGKLYVKTIKPAAGRTAGLFDRGEWEHHVPGPGPNFARAKGTALEPLIRGDGRREIDPPDWRVAANPRQHPAANGAVYRRLLTVPPRRHVSLVTEGYAGLAGAYDSGQLNRDAPLIGSRYRRWMQSSRRRSPHRICYVLDSSAAGAATDLDINVTCSAFILQFRRNSPPHAW